MAALSPAQMFRERPLEVRLREAARLQALHPGCIPIVADGLAVGLTQHRFLSYPTTTIGGFTMLLEEHTGRQGLFIVGGYHPRWTLGRALEQHLGNLPAGEVYDGFLYLQVSTLEADYEDLGDNEEDETASCGQLRHAAIAKGGEEVQEELSRAMDLDVNATLGRIYPRF